MSKSLRSFVSKLSFGDVDLFVTVPLKPLDHTKHLGSSELTVNGNIMSCEFRGYQVDIIEIPEDHMELARFFYGYGDTGMIFGMFVRNIGLKFGMAGLTLKCETYKINLSHNLKPILEFMGLSYESWRQGFETQEDIFRFIKSSKYFRPSCFVRSNPVVLDLDQQKRKKGSKFFESPTIWNHEARSRLAERPMFHAWIEYVETLPFNVDKVDTAQVKAAALEAFDKHDELQDIEEHLDLVRRVKAKFNGSLAMKWTDKQVTGKDLGKLMASFTVDYPKPRLDRMIQEQIQNAFVTFFSEHK